MHWHLNEIFMAASAGTAVLSLAVASLALWRTFAIARPLAWLQLESTNKAELWIARVYLRNRSSYDLKGDAVAVAIASIPISKKQEFVLVDIQKEEDDILSGVHYIKTSVKGDLVRPGETGVYVMGVLRSPISHSCNLRVTFWFYEMKSFHHRRKKNLKANLPSRDLTILVPRI